MVFCDLILPDLFQNVNVTVLKTAKSCLVYSRSVAPEFNVAGFQPL